MQHEARERLKLARTSAGLSVDDLARKIGRAASTVRAHENGQNQIREEMADLYSEALSVTPEWLLTGNGKPPEGGIATLAGISRVRVMPAVQRGTWHSDKFDKPERYDALIIPGYERLPTTAFTLGESWDVFRIGSLIITVPEENIGLVHGDHIVVMTHSEKSFELSMWRFNIGDDGAESLFAPATQTQALAVRSYAEVVHAGADMMGVVVTSLWSRPRIRTRMSIST